VVGAIVALVAVESHRGPGSPLSHGGNCRHAHAVYYPRSAICVAKSSPQAANSTTS